jgi:predicted TPR repeat methyltransferase
MRLTTVSAIYSDLARTYDRELRDEMQYTAYLQVPQLVINALRRSSASILDLGCGTGLSSLLFFEKGYQVTGIDGTGAMVRRARMLPYRKVVQQDLESPWRVKDQSFDAVVMVGVMEYIIYPAALFRRVHSKLVDGGLFGLTVPQKSKWYTNSKLKSYRLSEIMPVIVKAGFDIEFSETALGFEDAGEKVLYWNCLLRRTPSLSK